jgi:uncharacterized protein
MMPQSSAAIPAGLKENEILLPDYLHRQHGGILANLSLFPAGGGFAGYLDQLFGGGARFQGLDYGVLSGLLYDYDSVLDTHGIGAKLKLAEDVVAFPPLRRALYKAVKVDAESKRAEYLFEPVQIEVDVEVPVYGEPGVDGVAPVVGSARKKELQPAQLDIDEFVADMWLKGVRYGVAVEAVAEVIASGETVRIDIAHALEATEGCDAEIEEASDALRRDNSPKRLANGKADLRRFQNRFPQISRDSRLLKKKKRVLGKPGFKVSGMVIEPPVPLDFDLSALAGEGTRVENQGANEYIVASRDGFLSLDVVTNHIDVTEKIENKGGVSVKTTGDLSLEGDEFIEHGEVQEGRVVEGKNMTFRSDVYGDIVSQGGFILLEQNLSSGSAKSFGGDVTANSHAFNSIIEAWEGRVTVKYAESCLILGESVEIERAVNCEIIARNVQVGIAQGCAVAGKIIKISSSGSCRGKETIVSMLIPGLAKIDAQINQVNKAIVDCKNIIETKMQELVQIEADEEVVQYRSLETSIQQGSVKLNAEQQNNWQKMMVKFARTNRMMEKLKLEKQEQLTRIEAFQQELAYLLEAREKSGQGIHCEISEIAGDTLVRTMVACNGFVDFRKNSASELRIKLREQGFPQERVFLNDEGSLDWCYELPEIAP